MNSGNVQRVYLDLYRHTPDEGLDEAHRFAQTIKTGYPFLTVENILPILKRLRTLKAPCEIDAMRRAMTVTREGILRMMRASHPGMYEYEYKAEFDYALTSAGVLEPAFHSIISAGENNFCIHYDSYMGQAKDGDMILNDVGAQWDGECNDVSVAGRATANTRKSSACCMSVPSIRRTTCSPSSSPVCSWTMWIRPPAAIAVSS